MRDSGLVFSPRVCRGLAEPPSSVLYDSSRYGNNGTITGAEWVRLPSGLWGLRFDGQNDVVTLGDLVASIKTFLAWIRPDDNTTRSIADIDGGTHSVELNGSGDITATGWSTPTIYINASSSSAAARQNKWSFVAVTTATAIDASNVKIGQEASYYDGLMWKPRLSFETLSAHEIYSIYQRERGWFRDVEL